MNEPARWSKWDEFIFAVLIFWCIAIAAAGTLGIIRLSYWLFGLIF